MIWLKTYFSGNAASVVLRVVSLFLCIAIMSCKEKTAPAGNDVPVAGSSGSITVDAEPVARQKVDLFIEAVGSLEAAEDIMVCPDVAGVVKEVRFEEGSAVKKGKALVLLDAEMTRLESIQVRKKLDRLRASIQRMQAETRRQQALTENAKSNFERKKVLFEQGATTQAVFLDARTNYDSALAGQDEACAALEESKRSIPEAEAGLEMVEERLSNATVEAPFDGFLGERFVGPGDYADVGDGLVQLIAVDPLKAVFTVPERYRGSLNLDQAVAMTVEAWPGRVFSGKVCYIAPGLDPMTRSVKVKAKVDNEDALLRPGFFCKVRLIIDHKPDAVVIPEQAVIPRGEKFFVYTVEHGKAALKEIRPGQRLPGKLEVASGLVSGETVVTAGQHRLVSGSPVRIRRKEAAAADAGGNVPVQDRASGRTGEED